MEAANFRNGQSRHLGHRLANSPDSHTVNLVAPQKNVGEHNGSIALAVGNPPRPGCAPCFESKASDATSLGLSGKRRRGFQFSRQIFDKELYVSFPTVDRGLTVVCHRVPQDFSHWPWLIKAVVRVWIRYNFELCTRDDPRTFRFDAFSWRSPIEPVPEI
jgi:hypothetical protein